MNSTAFSDISWLLGWAARVGWKTVTGRPFSPPVLNFLVTRRCDLRCRHCFFWEHLESDDSEELSLEEIAKISSHMGPLFSLVLSGGEPFLRKDLPEIARVFHDQNRAKLILILTDGQLTERAVESVERTLAACPESLVTVGVSIDGVGRVHDEIRQKQGAFERAVATLNALKGHSLREPRLAVQTCTVLMRPNQDHILDLYRFIRDELSPDRVAVNLVRQDPLDPSVLGADPGIYLELLRTIEQDTYTGRLRNRFGFDRLALSTVADLHMMNLVHRTYVECRPQVKCYAGVSSGVLFPDGTVWSCELREGLGNVRECGYDPKRLWGQYRKEIFGTPSRASCFCTHEIDCFLPSIPLNLGHYPSLVRRWVKVFKSQARMQARPTGLSIIIPTLNEASYIGPMLEGLSAQSYRDFEVIVVDGASEDGTREVVESYRGRLPSLQLVMEEERGLARARNRGARAATRDDLVFMDADGVVDRDFLAALVWEMRRRGLAVASARSRPLSKRWFDRLFYRVFLDLGMRLLQFVFPIVSGACIAVRREVFEAVGGFDERIHFEDTAFVKCAAKKGRFRVLKTAWVSTSVRRLDADGRLRTLWKLLAHGFFRRLLRGEKPLADGFYTFGKFGKG